MKPVWQTCGAAELAGEGRAEAEHTETSALLTAVRKYYDDRLAEHGATFGGVDWKYGPGHQLRHRQFLHLVAEEPAASILDLGCGYGDFLTYLRGHGHVGRYTGVDISASMVATSRKLHGEGEGHAFLCAAQPRSTADYVIANGVFNVVRGADHSAWADYVDETIAVLARHARRGFGFNMLSLSSDPSRRREDLHYREPAAVLAQMLSRYGPHVALLQDYGLWEFTVLVRRHEGPWL